MKMKTMDCLCFGACVLDEIEDANIKNLGGDAANQAVLLRRLGLNAELCAMIGMDNASVQIIDEIQKHSLSNKWIRKTSSYSTTHSLIHLDEHHERTFTVTGCAHRELRKEDFPFELLKDCRAISLGSMFTLHHLEEDGLKEIFESAHQNQCMIFSDTSTDRHHKGLKKVSEFLPLIDYFMPSYNEAAYLTHKTEPDEIAECLLYHGANCVVLKLADKGAALYRKNSKIYIPAYDAEPVNTTGAGDNFCAGFIASILCGLSEKQALCNGCWMGARAVEKHGTTDTDMTSLPYPLDKKRSKN